MARLVGRFKCTDRTLRMRDSEEEFLSELNGADEEPQERPEQAAAREFKQRSRERWGNGGNQAFPSRPLPSAQNRDSQAKTPMQRFKAASRARRGGR